MVFHSFLIHTQRPSTTITLSRSALFFNMRSAHWQVRRAHARRAQSRLDNRLSNVQSIDIVLSAPRADSPLFLLLLVPALSTLCPDCGTILLPMCFNSISISLELLRLGPAIPLPTPLHQASLSTSPYLVASQPSSSHGKLSLPPSFLSSSSSVLGQSHFSPQLRQALVNMVFRSIKMNKNCVGPLNFSLIVPLLRR